MDYVMPGKVIKLGADGKVVLGYMKSCWHETITGVGTVIVGTEQSAVHLADFQASKVPCDSSQSQVVPREVGESAATMVRGINEAPVPAPALTLHGVSPIIETAGRGKLLIERLDLKGERHEVDLAPDAITRGRFYDLAKANVALKLGGTYAATVGSKQVIFLVDARADAGACRRSLRRSRSQRPAEWRDRAVGQISVRARSSAACCACDRFASRQASAGAWAG
jgi:hypothetical protein